MKQLFIDNNLPPALAESAQPIHRHIRFVHLRAMFPDVGDWGSVSDETWMRKLRDDGGSEAGWAAITVDRSIHTSPHLRTQWRQARITTFFCGPAWAKMRLPDLAPAFLALVPKMTREFEACEHGTALRVRANGRIERL